MKKKIKAKSLIDKMRTQLKKEEKKRELDNQKNKNNINFEEESTNNKTIPKIA